MAPMEQRPRARMLSLERRLPLVLSGVLVATLGVALLVTHRSLVRGAEQGAHSGLTGALQIVAGTLESSSIARDTALRAAAKELAVRGLLLHSEPPPRATIERVKSHIDPLLGRNGEAAVELIDRHGRHVAHWGADVLDRFAPEQRRVPPRTAADGTQEVWHPPFFVSNGGVYSWAATTVRDGLGRELGTLASVRRASAPTNLTTSMRYFTGEAVTLYLRNEGDSQWIAWPGHLVPAATRRHDTAAEEPPLAFREGVGDVITVERRIPNTPWAVVVEAPLASVLEAPTRTTRRLAIVFLMLAVGGTIVTWRISRGVTRPILQLTAAADSIARNRRATPVSVVRADELGQLARSFDAMAQQITGSRLELERRIDDVERANRAKADFLAMMSHELRTPLNAIAGYTQLLEMEIHGPVTADQREALHRITNSQRHLLRLIEDVLSFARLDAGRVEFTLAEVPLGEVMRNALTMVEPQARAKRITLVSICPEDGLTVYADREKLDQILINLLANAVKFTPADGRVELGARVVPQLDERGRELVQIRVTDTGPGVAPDSRATIFEPFVQGDRALNRPSEGVGLGLSISRDLTLGMGGQIALDSAPEGGATFIVTLLRHAAAPPPRISADPARALPTMRADHVPA